MGLAAGLQGRRVQVRAIFTLSSTSHRFPETYQGRSSQSLTCLDDSLRGDVRNQMEKASFKKKMKTWAPSLCAWSVWKWSIITGFIRAAVQGRHRVARVQLLVLRRGREMKTQRQGETEARGTREGRWRKRGGNTQRGNGEP